MTDLTRTLAAIAAPLGAPTRKDPPYDGHYPLDWEGVTMRVPYWVSNEDDLGTDYPDITLGPVRDWTVLGLDESHHGAADAIRDAIAEVVSEDYRAHQADADDRGDWLYERRKQDLLDRKHEEDAR